MIPFGPPEEGNIQMNCKRIVVLLTAVLFLSASLGWAAQAKAPAKAATTKAAETKSETAAKPKEHQATGTVVSFTDASLVISKSVGKQKSDWTFVRNADTKVQGTLAKDTRVTVYYHTEKDKKIAHRVKVLEAKPEAKAPAKSEAAPPAKGKAPKPKS